MNAGVVVFVLIALVIIVTVLLDSRNQQLRNVKPPMFHKLKEECVPHQRTTENDQQITTNDEWRIKINQTNKQKVREHFLKQSRINTSEYNVDISDNETWHCATDDVFNFDIAAKRGPRSG